MMDYLIEKLSDHSFEVLRITLLCEDKEVRERMLNAGRDEATIGKSLLFQQTFRNIDTVHIDTTSLSILTTVDKILEIREGD